MKKIIAVLGCLLIGFLMNAQTYTIPGATEQPAWVFPLWFEDALGNKDTLYFGYDPEAQNFDWPQSDSIFGENLENIDTAQFNCYWESGFPIPEALKIIVWNDLQFGSVISFYKTWYPPLTLRWDKSLFYSDVLPFPENEDAPRAWGEIITEGDMVPEGGCSFQYPFIMTDTPSVSGLACYLADSMVFQYGSLSGLAFKIAPWQPYWTSLENLSNNADNILFSPNPLSGNILSIYTGITQETTLEIFDLHGKQVLKSKLTGSNNYNLSIDIPPGIYIIQFQQENYFQTSKFIKL